MSLATRIIAGVLAALALSAVRAVAGVPATVAGDPCYHGFGLPALTVGADAEVKALPCAFAPTVTTIPVGGTVTFRNGDFIHLVTGANQAWGSRDVELQPNASVSYTFDEAGVYPYACALHRGMSGAIVVGDGGPALAAVLPTGQGSAAGATAPGVVDPGGSGTAILPVAVVALVVALVLGALAWRRIGSRRGAIEPAAIPRPRG